MSKTIPPLDPDNKIQVFNFNDNSVRSFIDDDGDPLFVAADVAKALSLTNVRQNLADLDDDEKGVCTVYTPGGSQQVAVVTEPGLYSLIMSSRKAVAKKFKRWITHEVLPALRKTGQYDVAPDESASEIQILQKMVDSFARQQREIKELREQQAQIALKQETDKEELNKRLDHAEYFTVKAYCQVQGIKNTLSLRQLWGREAARLSLARGIQVKKLFTPDQRWSSENMYHQSVLVEAVLAVPKRKGNQLSLLGDGS